MVANQTKALSTIRCRSTKPSSGGNVLLLLLILVSSDVVTSHEGRHIEQVHNASADIAPTQPLLTPSYNDLDRCRLQSHKLHLASSPYDAVEPCVLYDIFPDMPLEKLSPDMRNRTYDVTIVQVTPTVCSNHRDGAVTAVRAMNADSEGKGVKVGFKGENYVRFRFVAIVAGNPANLTIPVYHHLHKSLLESVVYELQPEYIIGTCSWYSALEKEVALKHKKILMAQVGPPGFYKDVKQNPYVFGMHVNSDYYPLPALKQLLFHINSKEGVDNELEQRRIQSIRVIYRTKSEFSLSTCSSVIREASENGFKEIIPIEYDPEADSDGNGVPNERDLKFLNGLADQACPPELSASDGFHPALFSCVQTDLEADTLLDRWRENKCRPSLVWMTPATWAWADKRKQSVPYFFGGGQWHRKFDYSDSYFSCGNALLKYNRKIFGYEGSYDMVVSYTIAVLFASHIKSVFRIIDHPDVSATFKDNYEEMRRGLLVLKDDTLFGPFSLNEYQRNMGRGAAGTQWLYRAKEATGNSTDDESLIHDKGITVGDGSLKNGTGLELKNVCFSPLTQAEAAAIVPAPVSSNCDAGEFLNSTRMTDEPGLLFNKCEPCPVDTFTVGPNNERQCTACPEGSTTMGSDGSTHCTRVNAHILPRGLIIMGSVMVIIVWILAFCFIAWAALYREDPVLRLGQIECLITLCVGAIISTSSIFTLGVQAGVEEDTSGATAACRAAPFLYSIGWVLQYSSLTAKSYRLSRLLNNRSPQKRAVTVGGMYLIIVSAVLLDLAIVLAWYLVEPPEYQWNEIGITTDPSTRVMTIEIAGHCAKGKRFWAFAGPLIALHASLIIATNVLLYTVRNVSERYQEQKFVGLASIYVCEILILGVPVLLAVGYSPEATYTVLCGIIFLDAIGMLLFIFVPKIRFQRKGLPEGVSVVQSILPPGKRTSTHQGTESSDSVQSGEQEEERIPDLTLAATVITLSSKLKSLRDQINECVGEENGLLVPERGNILLKNVDGMLKHINMH